MHRAPLYKKHGFAPVIKLRKGKPKWLIRREMAKSFELHREIYIPGADRGSLLGDRDQIRKSNEVQTLEIHENRLLVDDRFSQPPYLMRALALKEPGIFVLIWIYQTAPKPKTENWKRIYKNMKDFPFSVRENMSCLPILDFEIFPSFTSPFILFRI